MSEQPLRTYLISSTYEGCGMGPRTWAAETPPEALSQHYDAFPDEPVTAMFEVVHLVTVDAGDSDGPYVSVHTTEALALDALRNNYAEGDEIPDDKLVEWIESQGTPVSIEIEFLAQVNVPVRETLVATIVQKPGDEGCAYTIHYPDHPDLTIGDAQDEYHALAAILDGDEDA